MNVCESLTRSAGWLPEKTALKFDGATWSYRELDELSAAAASVLQSFGVNRGDRVALVLPNTPAFPVWYYAALRLGAIAVSVSTRLAPAEIAYVVEDCEPVALVAFDETIASLQDELARHSVRLVATCQRGASADGATLAAEAPTYPDWVAADPDEAALILYTSGTTGFPKGATLSHANVRSNVAAFNHLCDMQPADRMLLAVPLFHCFGQNALLNSALNVGATLIMQQAFDPNETRSLIRGEGVTQLYGVPMMFQLLSECCSQEDLASVRYCFSAAAPLPIQVADQWQQKFGLPIYEGYGLTETSPFATYNHRVKHVPGAIGTPIDAVEIKIIDPDSEQDVAVGEVGEIVIRGPNVMLGYWNRPDDTAAAIKGGWFHSGDLGRLDDQGFLYIVDRVKDMITVGGLKVFPAEVERVLRQCPGVDDVAVVGAPDAVFGEQVVAFVVAANGKSAEIADVVRQHAKSHLGVYKLPRQIRFVDQLPRNPSGKILKTELRALAATGSAGDATYATEAPNQTIDPSTGAALQPVLMPQLKKTHASERIATTTRFLQEVINAQVDAVEVGPDDRLLEAGLDSLALVELSRQLQVEVGESAELPATLMFDYPRICDLSKFLVSILFPEDEPNDKSIAEAPVAETHRPSIEDIESMTEEEALRALHDELES